MDSVFAPLAIRALMIENCPYFKICLNFEKNKGLID